MLQDTRNPILVKIQPIHRTGRKRCWTEMARGERRYLQERISISIEHFRSTAHLTVVSALDFEEAADKLLKMTALMRGLEKELCCVILEAVYNEKIYLPYYGILAQRLCMSEGVYRYELEQCFAERHWMVHSLEADGLCNVARFFAHLLATDAISWWVLGYVGLAEKDSFSASKIFAKVLFLELSELLGLCLLKQRLSDPAMQRCAQSFWL